MVPEPLAPADVTAAHLALLDRLVTEERAPTREALQAELRVLAAIMQELTRRVVALETRDTAPARYCGQGLDNLSTKVIHCE